VAGDPTLSGTGTLAAQSLNVVLTANAAPSAIAALFFSLSSTPVPFKGGTLKALPFLVLVSLVTDPTGAISLPFTMPLGVPPGTELYFQTGISDPAAVQGVSLSNALRGTTP